MVHLGEQLGLAGEVGGKRRARSNRRAQRLDRHMAPQRLLERVVDVGDRARSDVLDHATVAENLDDARHAADCSLQIGATSTTLGIRA